MLKGRVMFQQFIEDESGQTLVEYGILVALIALVVMVSVSILGERVGGTFENVSEVFKKGKFK